MTELDVQSLKAENEELRRQLEEKAQELEAIRTAEVDALVLEGPEGPRVLSLEGADHAYRVLVEAMNEGAATLHDDGTIVYCNKRFAGMVAAPLQRVTGSSIFTWLPPRCRPTFEAMLRDANGLESRGELELRAHDGEELPAYLSVSTIVDGGRRRFCLLASDLRPQKRSQEILASERLARAVLEQAAEVIVVCDEAGRIIRATSAAAELAGHNPLLAPFTSAFSLELTSPPPESEAFESVAGYALAGGVVRAASARFIRPGKHAHLVVSAAPVKGEGGRTLGCVVTMTDVTEQSEMAEELRRSEERLSLAITSAGMATWDANLSTGKTVWSESHFRLLGYEPSPGGEATPEMWRSRVHPDDLPRVEAALEAAEKERSLYVSEHRITRVDDGRIVWLRAFGRHQYDDRGRAVRFVGILFDETQRKMAEQARARTRRGLTELAKASALVVRQVDLEGMLNAIAEAALTLTGARFAVCGHGLVGNKPLVGGSARVAGAPACPPGNLFKMEKGGIHMALLEGTNVLRMTDREMRAHPRWWGLPDDHVPMRGLLGVRMAGRDGRTDGMILVTDKEQGEFTEEDESLLSQLATIASLALQHVETRASLEEANQRKTQFLAMLSHELRNPLSPIRNSLHILDRVPPGSEQARRAQGVIDRQVTHLTRLVDDLLDITRITQGKIQLKRTRLDLAELVRRSVEDHRSAFVNNGLTLDVEVPDRPLWVNADKTRLVQVLGNLLNNSAKFIEPPGSATVTVTANCALEQAFIRVRDTGVGIAAEVLPHIFDLFTQADTTLDRTRGGLGLGLSLVKGLVEMHGGSVMAASEGPGKGAEFTVRLPLEAVETQEPAELPSAPLSGRSRRILVIDDNIDGADTLRDALEIVGHSVEVAYSAHEGIDKARASKPEVVVCDIGLPGMDGYEVARRLRADPELAGVSLVALTGYASPEDVAKALEAGFDSHLAKPPSLDKLEQLIATVQPRAA